jgi:hypothetical protein
MVVGGLALAWRSEPLRRNLGIVASRKLTPSDEDGA